MSGEPHLTEAQDMAIADARYEDLLRFQRGELEYMEWLHKWFPGEWARWMELHAR